MNEVGFSKEYAALQLRYGVLKERVANQIEILHMLVSTKGPNLKARYMMFIGRLEYQVYELQVEFKRWKRRLALRQAVLNRGEEPDLDAIEETLKREFAEYLKEIARHLQELEESSRLFDAKSLSDEEDAAVRSAYLDAVKRLHPDLNPGLPQAARNLWDQIQQAYADHDWAAVLLLAGLAESVASGEADFAASADGIAALLLRRTARDAADRRAVAVRTEGGVLLGYLPRRHSAVMARLMDAGKCLSVKVVGKKLEGHWMDITVAIELKEM